MTRFSTKYVLARTASTVAGVAILIANWWLWGYWPDRMASLPAALVYRALIYGFQVHACTFLGFMIAESVSRFWWNRWQPVTTSAVTATRVSINVNGTSIGGILLEPVLPGPTNARKFIITSHGINDNQARAWHWAQGMAAAGFSVFTWDYRGRGGRKGRVTDMQGHVDDLKALIDFWHEQRKDTTGGGINLVGWSMGGMVSILAGMEDERVARIFAWSTWSRLDSVLRRIYANPIKLLRYALKGQLPVMSKQVREQLSPATYLDGLVKKRREDEARLMPSRKLFLCHARDDHLVPVADFHENCAIAGLPDWNQVMFQRGSHLMLRREPDIIGLLHQFLTRGEEHDDHC